MISSQAHIAHLISSLLYKHECVIIPDFGGFITNYKSANIDNVQGFIQPPSKSISFNQKLTNNDGLLVNFLSQLEQISYEESLRRITAFSKYCQGVLKNNEILSFPNVGRIFLDQEEKIQFHPENSTNFLLSSYGLPTMQVYPIIRKDKDQEVLNRLRKDGKKKLVSRLVPLAAVVLLLIALPLIYFFLVKPNIESNSLADAKVKTTNRSSMDFFGIGKKKNKKNKTNEVEEEDETFNKDSIINYEDARIIDENLENSIQEDTETEEEVIESNYTPETSTENESEEPVRLSSKRSYTVIIGCYSATSSRDERILLLRQNGLKPYTDRSSSGCHRVGINLDCAPELLSEELKEIRRIYGDSSWVLKK